MSNKAIAILFLIVAFVGFMDATYLAASHFRGIPPPCLLTDGCDTVTSSAYSKIIGIPVPMLGIIYYLGMLVLGLGYIDKNRFNVAKAIPWATAIGLVASIWFVYVQAVILDAFCTYCLLSAGTSTILFLLGIQIFIKEKVTPLLPNT
jgi:uncharacterized membrane protein